MADDLSDFLPYLLNITAEDVGREFARHYKDRYGMLRPEWRVLFHLGRRGDMTAKEICHQAALHKTKVSRAVAALERKRYLSRRTMDTDQRFEILSLTKSGRAVFADLSNVASSYERSLETMLGPQDMAQLKRLLSTLRKMTAKRARP